MSRLAPMTADGIAEAERTGLWRPPAVVWRWLEASQALPVPEGLALVHGDLHFRHLLVDEHGALAGVID
jgi:aminoglycoside phosphotransferase (APT) family kinase protein